MGLGSTVVLSACNLGREEIRAEGVVGLARGFFFAVATKVYLGGGGGGRGSKGLIVDSDEFSSRGRSVVAVRVKRIPFCV